MLQKRQDNLYSRSLKSENREALCQTVWKQLRLLAAFKKDFSS